MNAFHLDTHLDPESGQLHSLRVPDGFGELLRFQPGEEIRLNDVALTTRCVSEQASAREHLCVLEAHHRPGYKAGQRLEIRRHMTLGGAGLHTGPRSSLHIRYQLRRLPWSDQDLGLDEIWGPPLEAPLHVETLGLLGGKTAWFGPETRMRALAIGGSGPREHVSYEDGPVADVSRWLQTGFRTTFPGQMTVPGAMYYHPQDERWLWWLVRRPSTGGRIAFSSEGQRAEFAYFTPLKVHDTLPVPEISLFWGQGLDEAERVLAEQFDRFEEPPAWWYHTPWFWMHPIWQPGGSFQQVEQGVKVLADQGGIRGFGLAAHDVPWSGRDIDVRSLRASPTLGGDAGLRRVAQTIRERGGHSFVWLTRTGLQPGGDLRPQWTVRGEDGRTLSLGPQPGRGVRLDVVNDADPGCRDYLFDIVAYYVKEIGITGVFWDSGLQPVPPDFTGRGALAHPGEAMVAPIQFYDEIYRYGKSFDPDFFMFVEGISTEVAMNAFAVDNKQHGERSAHPLMQRLAHRGRHRLVWRSAWPRDISGAFPFVHPASDIQKDPGPATYEAVAADPMNRWLSGFLAEHGCRGAVGVADGVAVHAGHLVAGEGVSGPVCVPATLAGGSTLKHETEGVTVPGEAAADGSVQFELPQGGAYRFTD